MKSFIIVSDSAETASQSIVVALRRSILEAGCSAEHMRWPNPAAAHTLACGSCPHDEQCCQTDELTAAAQRIVAADASVFVISESCCAIDSPWLPLLRRLTEEERGEAKPRYLVLVSPQSALLAQQMTELLQKAVQNLQMGWTSLTLICGGSLSQAQEQSFTLGRQWAQRLTGC